MVRDARLWCRKSPEDHEIAPGFRHPSDDWKTLSLSVNPAVFFFSNQGRIRQRKKRKGSTSHQLCPRYSSPLIPIAPTVIRLWETFITFINSAKNVGVVMVFVLRTSSDNALYLYRVSWKYLERCQNFGADTMMKALTDERTLKFQRVYQSN